MQSIKRALDQQGQMIRVPCYIGEARRAIKQAQSDLTTQLGREPTTTEIAKEVELTEKKVSEIFNATKEPVPLDAPINEDSPDGSFSELFRINPRLRLKTIYSITPKSRSSQRCLTERSIPVKHRSSFCDTA